MVHNFPKHNENIASVLTNAETEITYLKQPDIETLPVGVIHDPCIYGVLNNASTS